MDTREFAKHMQTRIQENGEAFEGLLNRLKLAVISWSVLDEAMSEIVTELEPNRAGDQTLIKLLKGFQTQLHEHVGTGVVNEPVRIFVCVSHTMNYSIGDRYGKEARRWDFARAAG